MTKTSLDKYEYVKHCWEAARSYCEGVQDGTIICNENIRLAVKRHELDLLRDDIEFRVEAVERVYKFFSYLYVEEGKQFILEPFQAFIILALFGPYFKDTNIRKYLYAFLFIGRKNGKTTFAAALQLYFMMADNQSFPRSLLISASQKNAKDTSFGALQEMIKWSPAINARVIARRSNRVEFRDPSKLGWSQTTVMDTDRLEGYNPTSCILDEIHTYKDGSKFNVIKNGLGTKLNPMLFLISTGGYGKDSFCTQLVETGRRVLRNEIQDDRFFYLLYELEEGDDWQVENVWIKANPGLGTILDYRLFKDDFNTSKNLPSALDDFLTKRLNMFLEENVEWLERQTRIDSFKEFSDEIVKELPCYVGLDLSSTRDLTSIVCLWDAGDKFYAKSWFFFVNKGDNALRKGGIDVNKWIGKGYVIPCSTPTLDYDLLKQYLIEIYNKYKVYGLYYDPWHFDRLLNEAKDIGYWCVPVAPGVKNFDPALRFTEIQFYERKMNIYPNECMNWNLKNIVIGKGDVNGNIRPNKNESKDSIDGVISLLNAMSGYLQQNKSAAVNYVKSI